MLILVKLLAKYIILIYAVGSGHEKSGIRISAVPKTLQEESRNSWLS